MFSGLTALGSSVPQITHTNDVVFEGIRRYYVPGEDICCKYRHLGNNTPSANDWVGLYKVGWKSLREYVAFNWVKLTHNTEVDNSLLFSSASLPKQLDTEYQICYVSQGTYVRGTSSNFSITSNVPADVIESDSMLFVEYQDNKNDNSNDTNNKSMSNSSFSTSINSNGAVQSHSSARTVVNQNQNGPVASSSQGELSDRIVTVPLSQSQQDILTTSSCNVIPNSSSQLMINQQEQQQGRSEVNFPLNISTQTSLLGHGQQEPSSLTQSSNRSNSEFIMSGTLMPNKKAEKYERMREELSNFNLANAQQKNYQLLETRFTLLLPLINYITDGYPQLLSILKDNNVLNLKSERARRAIEVCLENIKARDMEFESYGIRMAELNKKMDEQQQLIEEGSRLRDEVKSLRRQLDSANLLVDHYKELAINKRESSNERQPTTNEQLTLMEEKLDTLLKFANERTNVEEATRPAVEPSNTNRSSIAESQHQQQENDFDLYNGVSGLSPQQPSAASNNSHRGNLSTEFSAGWQNAYDPVAPANVAPTGLNLRGTTPYPPPTISPQARTYMPSFSPFTRPPTAGEDHSNDYICPVCRGAFARHAGLPVFERHVNGCIDNATR